MLPAMVTMAEWGETGDRPSSPHDLAVNLGSATRAQLTFTTGPLICHWATFSENIGGTTGPHIATVRSGSVFVTTTRLLIVSPPSSSTPSSGWMAVTGTPDATTAPASMAASANANETWPMPPST